jgi:hypothetical protein
MAEGKNVYRGLVGKPEGKRPLERPGRRWEDGIKFYVSCYVGVRLSLTETEEQASVLRIKY